MTSNSSRTGLIIQSVVRRTLMFLVAVLTLVFWLPFGRVLIEGGTYEWGLFGIGGVGFNANFILPTVGVALALLLRWIGQRGSRKAAAAVMIGFFGVFLVVALTFALVSPESMVVRGDTVGMNLSIAWIGPILFGAATLAAFWWAFAARAVQPASGWSKWNRVWFSGIALLLLASVFLFLEGEPHGTTDEFGVRFLGWAWLMLDGVLIGKSGAPASDSLERSPLTSER